jgi:hypothetical protein
MNQCKLLRWGSALVVGTLTMYVSAGTSWDINNNNVTYSVFQDNFELGQDDNGVNITKTVSLSQLDLSEVASREGIGTAANYMLSSVVLSMNGTVYGTIKVINTGASSVSPRYVINGQSTLTYGSATTPDEGYSGTVVFPAISPGGEYIKEVNVVGSVTPETVTITEDLARFLGTGTLETIGAFPVYGYFTTGGTMVLADIALQGKADISVTYNYSQVPEPTSFALLIVGCAVLALRRKRVSTI